MFPHSEVKRLGVLGERSRTRWVLMAQRRLNYQPGPSSMISYAVYKVIHYSGIFILVTALGALLSRAATGREWPEGKDPWSRRLVSAHGIALFLILLGGFGMLARLDVTQGLGLPGWIWAKLAIWVALGAVLAARRSSGAAARALLAVPVLAVLAGIVALTKPF